MMRKINKGKKKQAKEVEELQKFIARDWTL